MSIRAVVFDIGGVLEITPDLGVAGRWEASFGLAPGTLNAELAAYFGSLRPRLQTAILSNSFVGAREREQAAYGFANLCDFIVYSHEVGIAKPDPRIYQLVCGRAGSGHARYSIHRHCSGDCRN